MLCIAINGEPEPALQKLVVQRVLVIEEHRRCSEDGWNGETVGKELSREGQSGVAAVLHRAQALSQESGARLGIGGNAADDLASTQTHAGVVLIVRHDLEGDAALKEKRPQDLGKPGRERIRIDGDGNRHGRVRFAGWHQRL